VAGALNPALEDARFCPRCGAAAEVRYPRSIHCPSCGYAAFFNPKPVACALPRTTDGAVWLVRRGFDPGRGLWSMPGGFVDLGESVEQAAAREVEEELQTTASIGALVGVYSHGEDRVIVVAYEATLDGEPAPTAEAPEIRAFAPDAIPWAELAFASDRMALQDLLRDR
jgi:ADP-ribose pyrophosphatase YjhB (NUDIX family)